MHIPGAGIFSRVRGELYKGLKRPPYAEFYYRSCLLTAFSQVFALKQNTRSVAVMGSVAYKMWLAAMQYGSM